MKPLKLPGDATEVIIESARAWCPDTNPEHGDVRTNVPVTLAGTLVLDNAEVLGASSSRNWSSADAPSRMGPHHGDGPQAGGGVCGLAGARPLQRRLRPDRQTYLLPSFVAGL